MLENDAIPSSLDGCSDRPNCIADDIDAVNERLRPIPFHVSLDQAGAAMSRALAALPRTETVVIRGPYLRAECRSPIFGFVDDVELLADQGEGLIHFRSASRVGWYDFGVNRRRLIRLSAGLRQQLMALEPV